MNKFIDLLEPNAEIIYDSVDYNYKGYPTDDEIKKLHINVFDKFLLASSDNEYFTVRYTRSVKLNPDFLFSIKIVCTITRHIKKELSKKINLKDYDLEKQIEENKNILIREAALKSSMLISQITELFWNFPIVTPPTFINKPEVNTTEKK